MSWATHLLRPGCGSHGYNPVWHPATAWAGPGGRGWLQNPVSYCSKPHTDACCCVLRRLTHTHTHCMEFLITVSCCSPDINVHMLNNYSFNHTPLSSSFSTTSEISNNLSGSAIFLFAATVFKSPGSSVVLATYTHNHIIYRRWCNTQMSLLTKHNIKHIRLLTTEYTAWTHQPPEYKVLRRALAIISDIIFEAHNVVTAETALRRLPTYSPA